VQGNVADSAKQVINVNLLDVPSVPSVVVPVITASGTLAGDFALGQLQSPGKGFVTMDFGLKTAASSVSLVMDVTGLNETGSLASALAPGAQSLVNAQVGSWRERMGVVPEQGKHGLAPWVRTFSDSGDVSLARSANFGPGGNGGFHQSNHGIELGLDTRLAEHLSAGVLIGTSEGSQRLTGGAGSDRLDGRTFGLYGTWFADNSFYFDVSQRWTGIRAHLRSGTAGPMADASASAFNVEAGVTAWTMAGIHVVPQLQYTHTRIDGISALSSQQSNFADHGGVSSRGRLGVAFDKTIQGTRFSWTPYGSVNAVREFDGKYGYAINGGLLGTTSTAGTSAMVEAGLGMRRGGLSITGGVNWTDGGALQNVIGGQLVMRYHW
jgi:outer membrane autotransporter protein